MQGEASALQNHQRMQSATTAKFAESHSFPQLPQKGNSEPSHSLPSAVQDRQQQQQQHLQNMQTSFPMYGSGGPYHPLGATNISSSTSSVKPQPHDFQMKQMPSQSGVPKFEMPTSSSDPKRMQSSSLSPFTGNVALQQGSANWKSSINKDQTSGHFSSSPYVKHEPIDHSNDQQNKSQMPGLQGLPSISAGQTEKKFPPLGTPKDNSLEPMSPGMGHLNAASNGPSFSESTSITSLEDTNAQVI